VKTQYNAICTPPLIASLSPNVSGYTSSNWGGNLVDSLDLANPTYDLVLPFGEARDGRRWLWAQLSICVAYARPIAPKAAEEGMG